MLFAYIVDYSGYFKIPSCWYNEHLPPCNNINKLDTEKKQILRCAFPQLLFKLQRCPVTISKNRKPPNTTIFPTHYEGSITTNF